MSTGRIVEAWRVLPSEIERALPADLMRMLGAITACVLAVIGGVVSGHFVALALVPVFAAGLVAFRMRSPTETRRARVRHWWPRDRARLGADGVAFGNGGFVRYRDVTEVEKVGDRLVLGIGREQLLVLAIAPDDWLTVEELLEHGRSAHARVAADGEVEDMLRWQAADDEATWRGRIQALRGDGGYRAAPIERARLWRVARDDRAEPSSREAACTLLARVVDAEELQAWTALRETTAHPGVGAALERMGRDA
jgi:hypothetical protein